MTREELIKELDGIVPKNPKSDWSIYQRKIVDLAIKALEQETVSKESYDHEYFLRKEFEIKIARLEHILDKISSEIERERSFQRAIDEYDIATGLRKALEILDKYKAETEDE